MIHFEASKSSGGCGKEGVVASYVNLVKVGVAGTLALTWLIGGIRVVPIAAQSAYIVVKMISMKGAPIPTLHTSGSFFHGDQPQNSERILYRDQATF